VELKAQENLHHAIDAGCEGPGLIPHGPGGRSTKVLDMKRKPAVRPRIYGACRYTLQRIGRFNDERLAGYKRDIGHPALVSRRKNATRSRYKCPPVVALVKAYRKILARRGQ
jgi:hypothetical protein